MERYEATPPHLHIAVIKLRLEAWIQEVFLPCEDT